MNINGLTKEEVTNRINNGQVNVSDVSKTKTIKEIILGNIFTYFNILNIVLGLAIIISGIFSLRFWYSIKNCLFLGVMIANTTISIIQEVMSKKTIDKLSLVTSSKINVLRDNNLSKINIEEIVLDDVIKLSIGNQIPVDAIILDGEIEVNESFITGESNTIHKKLNDNLLSGSFIVSGECFAKVTHVGKDNYINTLSSEAKKIEHNKSVIFNSFEKLVRILSYVLVPLGIGLFLNQYLIVKSSLSDAIINTVAALIGMIPEGLVLLTSSVMAVSVIKLSKEKVLVQQLYCIETLARVNVICLDKTGTITTGNMKLAGIIKKIDDNDFDYETKKVLSALKDNSSTMEAIRKKYSEKITVDVKGIIAFSSERKFSACRIGDTSYYLGAPEYVLKNNLAMISDEIKKEQDNYRVLVLAKNNLDLGDNPTDLEVLGYFLIEDEIRKEAPDTLKYFKEQGVKVKIISGDSFKTVLKIANKVGLEDIKGIDATTIDLKDINNIVLENDVFGRVTPHMKRELIRALKKNGFTVAMTGDGVNDVLALKEADCSVAMNSGADATKNISQLVLLDSNFASMPKIVAEGRRTINNIERSASLLLVKTIYTILLIFTCLFFKSEYFFVPIQLTLITSCTIGIPSFVLALEPNHNLVDGKSFLLKIFKKSIPGSFTVFFNVVILLLMERFFNIDSNVINALTVLITGITGFIHLAHISRPFNLLRGLLYGVLLVVFSCGALFFNDFFSLQSFNMPIALILLLLVTFSIASYNMLEKFTNYIFSIKDRIKNRKLKKV